MAYETGTATDIEDLIDVRLKNFAVAQGWTLNEDNWPAHIALSKGGCFLNMRWDQVTSASVTITNNGIQDLTDAFGVPRLDHKLWAHLATGYTPAGGWNGQVGSPVNGNTASEPFIQVSDLAGPFPSYHLFSDDGTGASYIYLVVETRSGYYSHFYFGEAETTGLNYSPRAAFATGSRYAWWPNSTNESNRDDFRATDGAHWWPFGSTAATFYSQYHVSGGAALPSEDVRPLTNTSRPAMGMLRFDSDSPLKDYDPTYFSSIDTSSTGHYATSMPYRGPLAVSGVQPLLPLPVMVASMADDDVYHYLGEVPDLRFINMTGITDGQILTIGNEEWIAFPLRRFQPWASTLGAVVAPSPDLTNSSFRAGVAIKRNS